ncbi:MAG: flagellar motor protein MotB [Alphaproteobacteria bacterium]
MAAANQRPIIIIRKKSGGHEESHGNTAWKIAYADFVTAMMAFFLLLWLLNSVTEEQMVGISNYFAPTSVSYSKSGAGGILGGTDMVEDGAMQDSQAAVGIQAGAMSNTSDPSQVQENEDAEDVYGDGPSEGEGMPASKIANADPDATEMGAAADAAEQARAADETRLEGAKEQLEQALRSSPEMQDLARHVVVDMTEEGLRIQIVDLEGRPLFTAGSAQLSATAAKLLRQVAEAVASLPNLVKISGHTDAKPYPSSSTYSNWELSADRANASRRALVATGMPEFRIREVVGQADTEPYDPEDPFAAVNRRITIVLRHLTPLVPADHPAEATASTPTEPEAQTDPE